LHSALGYRSPEEFERESGRTNSADSSGATVEFVVDNENSENQERDSKKLSGEEDSNAVLFPRPLLLLESCKCAQIFVSLRGFSPKLGNNLGTNIAEYRTRP